MVDAGGGGIIHFTAGVIALALCLVVSPADPKSWNLEIADPEGLSSIGQRVQSSCFFWAGFALVHGISVTNASNGGHEISLPEMVNVSSSEQFTSARKLHESQQCGIAHVCLGPHHTCGHGITRSAGCPGNSIQWLHWLLDSTASNVLDAELLEL